MNGEALKSFDKEIKELGSALGSGQHVLLTAPGTADGDSVASQLALKQMIAQKHPELKVSIVNDEPVPERYLFLPGIQEVYTPETCPNGGAGAFDIGIIVDGGIDRAARIKPWFQKCTHQVFIDHHEVSVDYPYTLRIVIPQASSTTELVYYLSQLPLFGTKVDRDFAQNIYLGLIFDTGFFRHSNTTPEAMELAAQLLRTGFDFTQVGERGMLVRSFGSLQLLSDTLSRAQLSEDGKIIWSALSVAKLKEFEAAPDDREGIIDHLFLTRGIQVAVLFLELSEKETRISFRSQGSLDVAHFARSLTECGGGHSKAAGANLMYSMDDSIKMVLKELSSVIS